VHNNNDKDMISTNTIVDNDAASTSWRNISSSSSSSSSNSSGNSNSSGMSTHSDDSASYDSHGDDLSLNGAGDVSASAHRRRVRRRRRRAHADGSGLTLSAVVAASTAPTLHHAVKRNAAADAFAGEESSVVVDEPETNPEALPKKRRAAILAMLTIPLNARPDISTQIALVSSLHLHHPHPHQHQQQQVDPLPTPQLAPPPLHQPSSRDAAHAPTSTSSTSSSSMLVPSSSGSALNNYDDGNSNNDAANNNTNNNNATTTTTTTNTTTKNNTAMTTDPTPNAIALSASTPTALSHARSPSAKALKKRRAVDLARYQRQVGFSAGCTLNECQVCEKGPPDALTQRPPPANLLEVAVFTLMCDEVGIHKVLSGSVYHAAAPSEVRQWITFAAIREFLHHHWASLNQRCNAEDGILVNNPMFLVDVAKADARFLVLDDDSVTLLVPRNVFEPGMLDVPPDVAPSANLMDVRCVLCSVDVREHGVFAFVHRATSARRPKAASPPKIESHVLPSGVEPLHGDWSHALCLFYASRLHLENDPALVARSKRHNLRCSGCKKRRATIGCAVPACKRVFHLHCAKSSGGDWHTSKNVYYCNIHVESASQTSLKISHFPVDCGIQYQRVCDWSGVPKDYVATLVEHRYCWENYSPMWFRLNLDTPLKVLPIGAGHWAYSAYLSKRYLHGHPVQYEVVAGREIDDGEVIGEYVGVVKFADEADSEYVAALYWPDNLPDDLARRPLVIDAAELGNETRYINSVNNETAHFIRQNATMNTVWCNGMLRILISATRHIPRGHPIVLDYEEHGTSYFAEKDDSENGESDPAAAEKAAAAAAAAEAAAAAAATEAAEQEAAAAAASASAIVV
jgi:hypothetical protein